MDACLNANANPSVSLNVSRRQRDRRNRRIYKAVGMAAFALLGSSSAMAQYQPSDNAAYDPPLNYYNLATSNDGATLKSQLYSTISQGFNEATFAHGGTGNNLTARTYGDLRYAARVLFKDTSWVPTVQDPYDHIIWVYEDTSHDYQWDVGVTWNREHSWPQSKLGASASNNVANRASDLFEVFPANSHTNSSRGNAAYGLWPFTGASGLNSGYFYPGDLDRGDVARALLYMATRYGQNQGGTELSLVDGQGGTDQMGHLTSLLHWNYEDGVNNFERRRNWLTYSGNTSANAWDTTPPPTDPSRAAEYNVAYNQSNRNPYIDHPEYVWSVFGGSANTSQLYVGASPAADGTSAQTVNLPRVMKNGTLGISSVTMTKTGTTPTTFNITPSGEATSTLAGTGRPFVYAPGTLSIPVGLSSSTSTTGLKIGTITVDNTDLTTAGTGKGSADGNDVVTVQAQVVDNRFVSASTAAFGRVIVGSNVTANTTVSSIGDDDHFTRITVKANASAADASGVFITAAGSDYTFTSTSTTDRTLQANFSTPGDYTNSRPFTIEGEGLVGEVDGAVSAGYTARALAHAQPSFTSDGDATSKSVDFGYVPSGFAARTGTFSIYNNPATGDPTLTAGLDIDGTSTAGSDQMTTNVTNAQLAAGSSQSYTATYTPTTGGLADATHTITTSDEDIPGASSRPDLTFVAAGYTLTAATFPQTGFMKLFAGETYNTGPFEIQSGVTLSYNGPGTMNITGAQSNGAGATLNASDGVINFDTDAGSPTSSTLVLNSTGTANVTFNATQHLASLTFNGTTVSVSPGANKVIVTSSLNTSAGHLDLSDNKLIVRGGNLGSLTGSAYDGITGSIQSGRNGGQWSGPGIITSQSTAQTSSMTTLAVATASDARGIGATDTITWAGETVSGSDVLVMYTYGGDATLDGKLNIDDYTKIDSGLANEAAGYVNGDFNYDGKVNIDDYTIIDSNIVNQGAPFDTSSSLGSSAIFGSVSAVPEPASVMLVALGGIGFLSRRRRRALAAAR